MKLKGERKVWVGKGERRLKSEFPIDYLIGGDDKELGGEWGRGIESDVELCHDFGFRATFSGAMLLQKGWGRLGIWEGGGADPENAL